MYVIPGSITPHQQAGDIGIYKPFKDLLYMEINAWKESDKVEYTRFGNPRMPVVAVVYSYLDWHVGKHDVYGERLCTSREAADEDHEYMGNFNLDELHDALDDAALIDE
ncbi:hypothetical protein PF005_g6566 [Phytophthora fragariae]|uniref:Uncharacterized protein n=1 Tax=Phytophthora fragariae TaxID=53985 RepID=A0A6A3YTY6_9STRA|nr:hypothetical protein PF011_g5647 [Phytophthora fragariae]KAE9149591.1 hypothetical protein PF006_g5938 [Phytophthora fragariae]KAE9222769.1 hypothetical protein PF005_g6566 [Phytophthora fragariae]KAE9244886.1 hypothetical protein PF004_g5487 [Phytophthora fragariae]